VSELLKKSEFEIACTLKGIDVTIPDDTSFDQAKFIMFQTGNIVLRSKHDLNMPPSQKKLVDLYFLS
jgi:hypothetical protein